VLVAGLAPEYVEFNSLGMVTAEKARHNLLRPEAMEAMFVLWRVTHKEVYREWAWQMFLAFEQHCKVRSVLFFYLKSHLL
jgi:mannosyl-oligosaccharide alpha-1,2-mannosidase